MMTTNTWIKVVYAKRGRKTGKSSDCDAQQNPHSRSEKRVPSVIAGKSSKTKNTNVGIVHAIPKDKFRKAFSKALSSRRRSLGRWLTSAELAALARSVRSGWNHTKLLPKKAGVGYIPAPTKNKQKLCACERLHKARDLPPLYSSFVPSKSTAVAKPLVSSKPVGQSKPVDVNNRLTSTVRHRARLSLLSSVNRGSLSSIERVSIIRDHLGKYPEDKKAMECYAGDGGRDVVFIRSDVLFPEADGATDVYVVSSASEVPSDLPEYFKSKVVQHPDENLGHAYTDYLKPQTLSYAAQQHLGVHESTRLKSGTCRESKRIRYEVGSFFDL